MSDRIPPAVAPRQAVLLHGGVRPLEARKPRRQRASLRRKSQGISWRKLARDVTLLQIAIGISIAVHAALLVVRFVAPEGLRTKPEMPRLEVVLVNARSSEKPRTPQALAQYNLAGGGEHEKGRVTSFLPNTGRVTDGETVINAPRASQSEESLQKLLQTQKGATAHAVAPVPVQANDPTPATPQAGLTQDLSATLQAMARLEAQLEKRINDYNARPRRGYIGPSTQGVAYALYYTQWKDRVERIGTQNYPPEARGRLYGELILAVTLRPDGSIYKNEVTVTRSSGHPLLDRAAERIVRLGAPYGRFSTEMRKDYDVFEIITKFSFMRGDAFEARIER